MLKPRIVAIMIVVAALAPMPVLAQQAASPPTMPNAPGVVATTNNPNLAVAAVKLEDGTRASKLIGTAVYNDANEKIGSVDDLILTRDNKVTVAIISVGGFLGLGSKLVAIPYQQLKMDADRMVLAGVTKDSLTMMPSFVY